MATSSAAQLLRRVFPASRLELELDHRRDASALLGFSLQGLAGRLGEVAGSACLAAATRLVLEAQLAGEPTAWLRLSSSDFFPPDLAEAGVDLAALPVVEARDEASLARAATHLARTGAFGLVVLDLHGPTARPTLPSAAQSQLAKLAQHHTTAVVCLTSKPADAPSLGSLVSVRFQAQKRRVAPGRFEVELRALKDKRRAPGWVNTEVGHGPSGLR